MLKTLKLQKKKPYKYTGPKICNNDEIQEQIVVLWSPEDLTTSNIALTLRLTLGHEVL